MNRERTRAPRKGCPYTNYTNHNRVLALCPFSDEAGATRDPNFGEQSSLHMTYIWRRGRRLNCYLRTVLFTHGPPDGQHRRDFFFLPSLASWKIRAAQFPFVACVGVNRENMTPTRPATCRIADAVFEMSVRRDSSSLDRVFKSSRTAGCGRFYGVTLVCTCSTFRVKGRALRAGRDRAGNALPFKTNVAHACSRISARRGGGRCARRGERKLAPAGAGLTRRKRRSQCMR